MLMNRLSSNTSNRHELAAGALMTLLRATGAHLTVEKGCVWVTEEGLASDTILNVGDRFTVSRPGLTIAQMLCDGALTVEGPQNAARVVDRPRAVA